jgi:isoleucyl-tRNA synthetase
LSDKKLGITSKADVMAMGIDKYNAECRAIVMRYSSEWPCVSQPKRRST